MANEQKELRLGLFVPEYARGKMAACFTGFKRKAVSLEITENQDLSSGTSRSVPAHPIAKPAIGWGTHGWVAPRFFDLLADAELADDSFVALGIVSL
jgi:hypothetical protein